MLSVSRRERKWLLVFAALVVAAVVIANGEWLFNAALRSYLAMRGVHTRYLQRGQTTICYLEGGEENAEALILLHGVGGNALSSWLSILPSLADSYHVIAPDLFFANLPDLVGSGYHVRAEEALVEIVMEEEKLGRVSLIGLSFGAWPAVQTAADRPERVNKLVLVSPIGGTADTIMGSLSLDPECPGRDFYYRIFESPPPIPAPFLRKQWDRTSALFAALPSFSGQLVVEGRSLDRLLRKVHSPTLVVRGANDRIIPEDSFQGLVRAIPRCREVVIPSSGHAVVWDQPRQLEEVIRDFLKKEEE